MWVGHDSFISNGRVIYSFESLITLKQPSRNMRGRQNDSLEIGPESFYTLSFRNSDPQKPIAFFKQLLQAPLKFKEGGFKFEVELKLEKKTSEREIILGPENEPKIVAPR